MHNNSALSSRRTLSPSPPQASAEPVITDAELALHAERPLSGEEAVAIAKQLHPKLDWTNPSLINIYKQLVFQIARHCPLHVFQDCWDRYFMKIPTTARFCMLSQEDGWLDVLAYPNALAMYQHIENSPHCYQAIADIINNHTPLPMGTFKAFCLSHPTAGFKGTPIALHRQNPNNEGMDSPELILSTLVNFAASIHSPESTYLWAQGLDAILFDLTQFGHTYSPAYSPTKNNKPSSKGFEQLIAILLAFFEAAQKIQNPDDEMTFSSFLQNFNPPDIDKHCPPKLAYWLKRALSSEDAFLVGCTLYKDCLDTIQPYPPSAARGQIMQALGVTPSRYEENDQALSSVASLWRKLEKTIDQEKNQPAKKVYQTRCAFLLATLAYTPEDNPQPLLAAFSRGFAAIAKRRRRSSLDRLTKDPYANATQLAEQLMLLANAFKNEKATKSVFFTTHFNQMVTTDDLREMNFYRQVLLACDFVHHVMSAYGFSRQPDHLNELLTCLEYEVTDPKSPDFTLSFYPDFYDAMAFDLDNDLARKTQYLLGILNPLCDRVGLHRFMDSSYFIELFKVINTALANGAKPDPVSGPQPSPRSPNQIKQHHFLHFCHRYAHAHNEELLSQERALFYLSYYTGFNPDTQHKNIQALFKESYSSKHLHGSPAILLEQHCADKIRGNLRTPTKNNPQVATDRAIIHPAMLHYTFSLLLTCSISNRGNANAVALAATQQTLLQQLNLSLQPFNKKARHTGAAGDKWQSQYYAKMHPLCDDTKVDVSTLVISCQLAISDNLPQEDDEQQLTLFQEKFQDITLFYQQLFDEDNEITNIILDPESAASNIFVLSLLFDVHSQLRQPHHPLRVQWAQWCDEYNDNIVEPLLGYISNQPDFGICPVELWSQANLRLVGRYINKAREMTACFNLADGVLSPHTPTRSVI